VIDSGKSPVRPLRSKRCKRHNHGSAGSPPPPQCRGLFGCTTIGRRERMTGPSRSARERRYNADRSEISSAPQRRNLLRRFPHHIVVQNSGQTSRATGLRRWLQQNSARVIPLRHQCYSLATARMRHVYSKFSRQTLAWSVLPWNRGRNSISGCQEPAFHQLEDCARAMLPDHEDYPGRGTFLSRMMMERQKGCARWRALRISLPSAL